MLAATPSVLPLEVKNITKRFRQGDRIIEALKDVSLTIHQGEFVAVMGASGSGKSTLLHALAGLTAIDGGHILIQGQDLAGLSDAALTKLRRQKIGLVFQSFNLIPILTAQDNVRLPAVSKDGLDAKVSALLDRLGIADRRSHKPDALSGGEQQRVAIARALITDPAIVLADEPTGSLDSVTGQAICKLLKELCKEQNRTIIVVTHEPAVAVWADRAIVLKDGRLVADLNIQQVNDPQTLAAEYQAAVNA